MMVVLSTTASIKNLSHDMKLSWSRDFKLEMCITSTEHGAETLHSNEKPGDNFIWSRHVAIERDSGPDPELWQYP